jgi:hypothetical protein
LLTMFQFTDLTVTCSSFQYSHLFCRGLHINSSCHVCARVSLLFPFFCCAKHSPFAVGPHRSSTC